MNTEEYLEVVAGKKGQFIKLCWRRNQKTAAAFKHLVLEKQTIAVVRTGMDYDKLRSTIIGRATGELPPENAGLQWGKWDMRPGYFGYVIHHKGTEYARIYSAKNQAPEVRWFINGAPIPASTAYIYMTPSDAESERNRVSCWECFTVKMTDILPLAV